MPDVFVWHPKLTKMSIWDIVRVSYYATASGDDNLITSYKRSISQTNYFFDYNEEDKFGGRAQIVPLLFKKPAKSHKTRIVDVSIAIDFMRYAHNPNIELIVLLTGDSDFIPLITEGMRLGKQVYVGAFSSGIGKDLCHTCDEFFSLDEIFFRKRKRDRER